MSNLTILPVYLAAAALLLFSHLDGGMSAKGRFNGTLGLALAVLGFTLHSFFNYEAVFHNGTANLNLPNSLSIIGWQVALFATVSGITPQLRGVAAMLLLIGALTILPSIGSNDVVSVDISGWKIQTHILLSIFSYSLLTIAAFLGLCLAYQDRQFKRARSTFSMQLLPPMDTTERTFFNTVAVGFSILSLAIFSGLIFVENFKAQHLTHKTLLSIISWFVFGVLIVGRVRFGWRRKAVYWTLAAMVILALGYFGSKFVLEVLLDRRWG